MTRRLLIRPGAIGDCIVSLPALEHLNAEYTEVWTAGQNVPLIRFADRVRSILSTGMDAYPPRLELLGGFDEIVSWYGTNRTDFREAAAQYPIRFLDALPNEPNLHATDFYLRQVGAPPGAIPRIDCTPVAADPFIAVHPYSGSPRKNWLRFAEFAAEAPLPVRFCVSPEQHWPGAVQYDNLYDLGRWLAGAAFYVGNDSGISHLAAAVGVPSIVIFQASDPTIWAPRGSRVTVLDSPTLEELLAKVRIQLPSG
ncbi:MAG TPA: glycosyltransferase family 9 protein [Bryobacteraceae bacterium]|nr:glycosyltransferase family 9 protein [Bryobacteraceae bacterium]